MQLYARGAARANKQKWHLSLRRFSIDAAKVSSFRVFTNALMRLHIVLRTHERLRFHSPPLFLPSLFCFRLHFTRKFDVQQVARQDDVDSL